MPVTILLFYLTVLCGINAHIINKDRDFSRIKNDPQLAKYVKEIVERLNTFKIPVHPRTALFYDLLKQGMTNYSHRTADSLYKPDKYNKID